MATSLLMWMLLVNAALLIIVIVDHAIATALHRRRHEKILLELQTIKRLRERAAAQHQDIVAALELFFKRSGTRRTDRAPNLTLVRGDR